MKKYRTLSRNRDNNKKIYRKLQLHNEKYEEHIIDLFKQRNKNTLV